MKPKLSTMMLAMLLTSMVATSTAFAEQKPKDRTRFDCLEAVYRRAGAFGGRMTRGYYIDWVCPHKDKMAAGQCAKSWLWGMRCKN